LTILDNAIGDLVEAHPDITLLLTADHGMSSKTRMIDLKSGLGRYGIRANPVPIIKDRYTAHHSNLGGCIFVYLDDPSQSREALKILRGIDGVEEALERSEAATKYRLYFDRLGDIIVNAESDAVFGDPSEVKMPPRLRSHASVHERTIPLLGHNGDFANFSFDQNLDLGRYVFEKVLTGD